jgi:hypothetical protein
LPSRSDMVADRSKTPEVASANRRIEDDEYCCLCFPESRMNSLSVTLRKVFMCALNASDFTSEADASCIYVILPACASPENSFR